MFGSRFGQPTPEMISQIMIMEKMSKAFPIEGLQLTLGTRPPKVITYNNASEIGQASRLIESMLKQRSQLLFHPKTELKIKMKGGITADYDLSSLKDIPPFALTQAQTGGLLSQTLLPMCIMGLQNYIRNVSTEFPREFMEHFVEKMVEVKKNEKYNRMTKSRQKIMRKTMEYMLLTMAYEEGRMPEPVAKEISDFETYMKNLKDPQCSHSINHKDKLKIMNYLRNVASTKQTFTSGQYATMERQGKHLLLKVYEKEMDTDFGANDKGELTYAKYDFPKDVWEPEVMEEKYSSKYTISKILVEFPKLRHLEIKKPGRHTITHLPTEIEALSELRNLYLNDHSLAVLPDLSIMKKLKRLRLSLKQDFNGEFPDFREYHDLQELQIHLSNSSNSRAIRSGEDNERKIELHLSELTNLEELVLSRIQLPDDLDLSKLEKLEYLRIISSTIETIKFPKNLKHLILNSCQLKTIDESLKKCELNTLDLQHNKVVKIPTWILDLPIKELKLSYNQLDTLPIIAGHHRLFNSIEKILLSGCLLTDISTMWFLPPSLYLIDLSNNQISLIPNNEQIDTYIADQSFKERIIKLSSNPLQSLPDFLFELPLHPNFELTGTKIEIFPSTITNVKNLRKLIISNNKLTKLQSDFERLPQLQLIKANQNSIEAIEMSSLPSKLEELDLSKNKLASLPDIFSQDNGPLYIQNINIRENKITSLPRSLLDWIENRHNMSIDHEYTRFNFHKNRLELLPKSLVKFMERRVMKSNQNELILSHQALKQIPQFSKQLSVWRVDLSHNRITELAFVSWIDQARNINISNNFIHSINSRYRFSSAEYLNFSHNRLVEISDDWLQGKNLATFDISHNLVSNISMDVITSMEIIGNVRLNGNKVNLEDKIEAMKRIDPNPLKTVNVKLEEYQNRKYDSMSFMSNAGEMVYYRKWVITNHQKLEGLIKDDFDRGPLGEFLDFFESKVRQEPDIHMVRDGISNVIGIGVKEYSKQERLDQFVEKHLNKYIEE